MTVDNNSDINNNDFKQEVRGKFLVVDGSSLVHRAFFALPILTNPQGEYTNAVYGFAGMLTRIIEQERPVRVAVCFDKSRHTFRTDMYAEYKGQRAATPNELSPQFESCKRMLEAMGIAWEEIAGFEADDIIGTLAKKSCGENDVLILTGDRDSYQLIDDHISVIMTKKGITVTELWDKAMLREHYDLEPGQMIDLKALMGDASDNIPGIPGIGEKTALKLLWQYHDLDNVLTHASEVSGKALRAKLENGHDIALLSRKLATIECDMPGLDDLSRYDYAPKELADNPQLIEFYRRMGFTSFLKKVNTEKTDIEDTDNKKTDANSDADSEANAAKPAVPEDIVSAGLVMPEYRTVMTAAELKDALNGSEALAVNHYKGCWAFMAIPAEQNQDIINQDNFTKDIIVIDEQALLADMAWLAEKKLLGSDLKSLLTLLKRYNTLNRYDIESGINCKNLNDVGLAAYLLDPTASDYQPHRLAEKYLGVMPIDEKKQAAAAIAAYGVTLLPELEREISVQIAADSELAALYQEVELPLTVVLAGMEACGIIVDRGTLAQLNSEFSRQEMQHAARVYELAGRSFNINSPKQLGEVLFEEMKLPPLKKTKRGYSTDVEVLEQLAEKYEIASEVLEYRSVAKLRSTYAEGLQNLIADDGRLHTSFNQTVTATGRLSSTEPNLQNIPVRTEMGRRLRQAFWASPGSILLAADYSQIELRVLAEIAEDEVLRQSFRNREDIHARTAAEVFGLPIESVTPEQRRRAKAVNFGIVYGISEYGLSKDLGISRGEAKSYIDAYLARYEGVRRYMHDIVISGKELGYVQTLCGRKRWLPDLKSKNFNLRSFAERTALNTPIQGTAADIIKLAMLRVDAAIRDWGLKSRMLLQVHDELIFDVPENEVDKMCGVVREAMENALVMQTELLVDIKVGRNWYDMQKIK